MITSLTIWRFKGFAEQTFEFAPLTLFAGANATGKSSVIQALLLLRQAYLRGDLQKGELPLNGELAAIGRIKDAAYAGSIEDSIVFALVDSLTGFSHEYRFVYPRGEGDKYRLQGTVPHTHNSILFAEQFTYLNAERRGPRLQYPISQVSRKQMNVGMFGEYAVHVLNEFGTDPIENTALGYPGESNLQLNHQTQLWMRHIAPDIQIESIAIADADIVRLGFRFGNRTDYFRPPNFGFGISYSLPIVVAALTRKPETLLIVENPEAHLHPSAQSKMGEFLARSAASGLQVIVETHSDHILNGIRLSAKRGLLKAEQLSIQYFKRDAYSGEQLILTPKIDQSGRINEWPEGFFDQAEKDLLELL